jgi:hypothetical protein
MKIEKLQKEADSKEQESKTSNDSNNNSMDTLQQQGNNINHQQSASVNEAQT